MKPMADSAAGREASIAAGDVTALGGAALVPMVEPAEQRQRDDCCSAFRLVDFSTVGCVLAEGTGGSGSRCSRPRRHLSSSSLAAMDSGENNPEWSAGVVRTSADCLLLSE